ncbi:MAG TPA: hypothetical protein PLC42_07435 [Parachlamydiaceae bacterium]|nr:hypothetical protein [Parachlamydiaceae bacterium]
MNKTEVKLFAGFFLKPELAAILQKSAEWKTSQVVKAENDLIEIKEGNKRYIGIYLKEKMPAFKTLQQTEKELKKMLLKIASDIATDELQLQVFSKLFVL